jgi:LacI family transcriptional regulator
MATIKDVARLAEVSYTTVSHVINHSRVVAPETVRKVEAAIHALGFHPNSRARSLKTGKSGLIGVVSCSQGSYFDAVVRGAEFACAAAGSGLLVWRSSWYGLDDGEEYDELNGLTQLASHGVDGLILESFDDPAAAEACLKNLGIPGVYLQSRHNFEQIDSLSSDDLAGGLAATRHLLALGHRRIACIGGFCSEYDCTVLRVEGWRSAYREAGLEVPEDLHFITDWGASDGYAAFEKCMGMDNPPSALFFYSDLMASGALRAAADRGLKVPEDISVVGFDDIDEAAFMVPRLSTVRQEKAELGRRGVEALLARIAEPDRKPSTSIIPVKFLERESTGSYRAN